jgi:poly(A) polymerase
MKITKQKLTINSKAGLKIVSHIKSEGGAVRFIGGAVRDLLIGLEPSDIDIATDLLPNQIIEILQKHHIKVIPTGIKFGTVTAFLYGEACEITTLRKDISSDGRRANVKFTKDFYIDAERRDFTINALSYCPFEHEIYDYFNGLDDLKKRKVVFIGKAEDRIKEDFLRILRFFRFSSRFSTSIDSNALQACELLKSGLKTLSRERIKSEIDLLFKSNNYPDILQLMFDRKILQEIFPFNEFDKNTIIIARNFALKIKIKLAITTIYALLFKQISALDKKHLKSLTYSRQEMADILSMTEFCQTSDANNMQFKLKSLWLENNNFAQYFILAFTLNHNEEKIIELYNRLITTLKTTMPVSGTDITKKIGHSGKKVGEIINLLKKAWIDSDFLLNKNDLMVLLDEYYDK